MRVLAIDPGTIKMGYGFLTGEATPEVVDHGVVELSRYTDIAERLFQMYTHVRNMISIFQPDAVAVEEPFVGRGDRQFIKPAIAVGQAQAVVLIGAASAGIPVHRYSPAEVKRAVADYGAATKDQMQRALAATLRLDSLPQSDAADALSVGLCHLIRSGEVNALSREITPGSER